MLKKRGLKNKRRQNKEGNSKNPRKFLYLSDRKSGNKDVIQKQSGSTDAISLVGSLDNKKIGSKKSNSGTIISGIPDVVTYTASAIIGALFLIGGAYAVDKKFGIFGKRKKILD